MAVEGNNGLNSTNRPGSMDVKGMERELFPFDAFEYEADQDSNNYLITLKDPWTLDGGKLAPNSVTADAISTDTLTALFASLNNLSVTDEGIIGYNSASPGLATVGDTRVILSSDKIEFQKCTEIYYVGAPANHAEWTTITQIDGKFADGNVASYIKTSIIAPMKADITNYFGTPLPPEGDVWEFEDANFTSENGADMRVVSATYEFTTDPSEVIYRTTSLKATDPSLNYFIIDHFLSDFSEPFTIGFTVRVEGTAELLGDRQLVVFNAHKTDFVGAEVDYDYTAGEIKVVARTTSETSEPAGGPSSFADGDTIAVTIRHDPANKTLFVTAGYNETVFLYTGTLGADTDIPLTLVVAKGQIIDNVFIVPGVLMDSSDLFHIGTDHVVWDAFFSDQDIALIPGPGGKVRVKGGFEVDGTPYDTDWHYVGDTGEPAFLNGWTNYGGSGGSAKFRKDAAGNVFISGLIKSGTVTLTAFTLPDGYRPSELVIFAVQSNGSLGRMDIDSVGNVLVVSGSNSYFSLECSFNVGGGFPATGPTGPQGPDGATGATGPQGATGVSVVAGSYDPGTTYNTGDYCLYSGRTYQSLDDSNTGNTPDSSPTYWEQKNYPFTFSESEPTSGDGVDGDIWFVLES